MVRPVESDAQSCVCMLNEEPRCEVAHRELIVVEVRDECRDAPSKVGFLSLQKDTTRVLDVAADFANMEDMEARECFMKPDEFKPTQNKKVSKLSYLLRKYLLSNPS